MQWSIVLCALLLVAARASTDSDSSSSQSFAREWLAAHQAPQGDELSDLKTANPEAYAIVKALLVKQQMGILNMHAPSKTASSPEEAQSQPAPAKNWLSWKPSDSALDDASAAAPEAPANNGPVITKMAADGAALDVDSSSDSSAAQASSKSGNEWGSIVSGEGKPLPQNEAWSSIVAASTTTPAASTAPAENSYLKNVDLNVPEPQAASPPSADQNVYLKQMESPPAEKKDSSFLKRKEKQSVKLEEGQDALASFSWDDDAPTTPKVVSTTTPMSSLDAFLGNTPAKKPPTKVQKKVSDAETRLSDFSFDDSDSKPAKHKDGFMQQVDDSVASATNGYMGYLN